MIAGLDKRYYYISCQWLTPPPPTLPYLASDISGVFMLNSNIK